MAANSRSGDWQCPNTGCINHAQYPTSFVFGSKVNCPKCGTGKSASRPGDWCCPNQSCVNHQNTVYASKTHCQRCGTEKPPLNARGMAAPNSNPHLVGSMMEGGGKGPGGVPLPRMGDWHCPNPTCKNYKDNLVFASKDYCPVCGTEKPVPPPGAPGPSMPAPPQRSGPVDLRGYGGYGGGYNQGKGGGYDGGYNQGKGGGCGACGGLGPGGVSPVRAGDWHCSNTTCKNHTDNVVFSSKTSCPICGMPKPDDAELIIPAGRGAPPPSTFNPYGGKGGGCGGFGGLGPGGVSPARAGDWHCSNPTCKNHTDNVVFSSKTSCPICGMPKPDDAELSGPIIPGGRGAPSASMYNPYGGKGGGKSGGKKGQPGDWHCSNPTCKNHTENVVYASKMVCPICDTPKPWTDILVSSNCRPGDWQCPNTVCKNHVNGVYASKPVCNLCGMANPGMDGGRHRSRSPRQA